MVISYPPLKMPNIFIRVAEKHETIPPMHANPHETSIMYKAEFYLADQNEHATIN